jgi:hypothetical protein
MAAPDPEVGAELRLRGTTEDLRGAAVFIIVGHRYDTLHTRVEVGATYIGRPHIQCKFTGAY